jgi:hypothetical protein
MDLLIFRCQVKGMMRHLVGRDYNVKSDPLHQIGSPDTPF